MESREEYEDIKKIIKGCLGNAKKQKESAKRYCEEIADIMKDLKTDKGKKYLAEITQENYKQMLELDIKIGMLDKWMEELEKYFG